MNMNARLVYVADSFAYFTTRPDYENQWGDDWDDAPFEHNAGEPYDWRESMGAYGVPQYEIVKVAFEADLANPQLGHANSPHSVEDINRGAVPWLRSWDRGQPTVVINAGCSVAAFVELIEASGGTVYFAREAVTA